MIEFRMLQFDLARCLYDSQQCVEVLGKGLLFAAVTSAWALFLMRGSAGQIQGSRANELLFLYDGSVIGNSLV